MKHLPAPEVDPVFNQDTVPWQRVLGAGGVISQRFVHLSHFSNSFILLLGLSNLKSHQSGVLVLAASICEIDYEFQRHTSWCLAAACSGKADESRMYGCGALSTGKKLRALPDKHKRYRERESTFRTELVFLKLISPFTGGFLRSFHHRKMMNCLKAMVRRVGWREGDNVSSF